MKKKVAVLIFILVFSAKAALYLEYEVKKTLKNNKKIQFFQKIWLGKHNFRLERKGIIIIGDYGKQEVYFLHPERKTYFKTSFFQIKEAYRLGFYFLDKWAPEEKRGVITFKIINSSKRVNGYNCKKAVLEIPAAKQRIEIFYSEDLKNDRSFLELFVDMILPFGMIKNLENHGIRKVYEHIPVLIKTTIETEKGTIISEQYLRKWKEVERDDLFSVPKGYRRVFPVDNE